ncbi:MAG: hypothetical protein QHH75_08650 [Bacillota bacterium]|nr:hypothetical protein [Bacillota bacterium]
MRAKKAGLLICIVLIAFLFNACTNKSLTQSISSKIKRESTNDIELPCLVYQQQGEKITAIKANWDIKNGKLNISKDDEAFSFDAKNSYKIPEYWDGKDKFIIPDFCRPSDNYKKTIKLIPLKAKGQQKDIFIGDNIEVEKIKKDTGELEKYRITAKKDGDIITKEVKFDINYKNDSGKEIPLDPIGDLSFVYYDGENAYFVYVRQLFSIFIVKYNMLTGKQTVNEIKLPDDTIDFQTIFLQDTVENVGKKFYAPTVDGIGLLDLHNNTFAKLDDITNKCKNFIKSTGHGEVPEYFLISGIYNDQVLVVGVPVHTGQTYEHLYCAIKDNQIIGAIYRQNQMLLVMDNNKNIKSRINMKEMNIRGDVPLAFPGKNGLNW